MESTLIGSQQIHREILILLLLSSLITSLSFIFSMLYFPINSYLVQIHIYEKLSIKKCLYPKIIHEEYIEDVHNYKLKVKKRCKSKHEQKQTLVDFIIY